MHPKQCFNFVGVYAQQKQNKRCNYHYHYNHSTLMGIKQINTTHVEPLLHKQTSLKKSALLMKLLYPHLSNPFNTVSICSYTVLYTILLVLTTSPWIVLWECFKLLCNLFPAFHITNWWFWQQFSSISQEIWCLFVHTFPVSSMIAHLKSGYKILLIAIMLAQW